MGRNNVINPLPAWELFSFYCVALVSFASYLCRLQGRWNLWRCAHFSSCVKLPAPFVALCALKMHMRCLLITVSRFDHVGVNGNSFHTMQMCFDRNGALILSLEQWNVCFFLSNEYLFTALSVAYFSCHHHSFLLAASILYFLFYFQLNCGIFLMPENKFFFNVLWTIVSKSGTVSHERRPLLANYWSLCYVHCAFLSFNIT